MTTKNYNYIVKTLNLYRKVIDAIEDTTRPRKDLVVTIKIPGHRNWGPSKLSNNWLDHFRGEGEWVPERQHTCTITGVDSLVNERFMRVLRQINNHFKRPVLSDQLCAELNQIFCGNDSMTGAVFSQKLWSIPPELIEGAIAIAIVRDFLSTQHGKIYTNTEITVNGKTTKPWREFCEKFIWLLQHIKSPVN